MATGLLWELREAIEHRLQEVAPGEVTRATAKLSEQYRASMSHGAPVARSHLDVLAYAAYRLPATFAAVRAALQATGVELEAQQGPDPTAWRADATAERITFAPGLLPFTMRYTNRPSGIQQVIEFKGHR